jgi:predicted component of type VI protein secretion system
MDKQDKKTVKDSLVDRNEVFVDNDNVNEVINKFARITNSIAGLNEVVTWRW